MADYESLIHLSRWRRLVIWLCEDSIGRSLSGFVAITILCIPIFLFGKWGIAIFAALVIGFVAGYKLARSYAASGQIPPDL